VNRFRYPLVVRFLDVLDCGLVGCDLSEERTAFIFRVKMVTYQTIRRYGTETTMLIFTTLRT
jgi:hypothetical protein